MTDHRTFIDSSQNLLFRNSTKDMQHDLRLLDSADLRGFQEAAGTKAQIALSTMTAHGYGLYQPGDCPVPIAWKIDTFEAMPETFGTRIVTDGHPTADLNPSRSISWVGLKHRATGKRVLRFNTHAVAGYAKDENDTPWGDALDAWKNKQARLYWLALVKFTAQEMRRGSWDIIIAGGDFNAQMDNTREWYYPGRILRSLYRDSAFHGIDHIIATRDSDVRPGTSRTLRTGVRSDHPIITQEWRL